MRFTKSSDTCDFTMSLGDHLEELRWRLVLAIAGVLIATVLCLVLGPQILHLIQLPYNQIVPDKPLTTFGPADGFTAYMKISLISGLVISSPWVFYQLWMFIGAGLYPKEKKYVYCAIPFCAFLFISGALFFVIFVAPVSLKFFIKFNEYIGVSSTWEFKKYIALITSLTLVFGAAFQTPVAIFILTKIGLVSIDTLKKTRKYALLTVFVLSAIVTPPDVVSQVALAIPLYMLFELGILLSYISGRKLS